jgi:hypothetical protein
MNVPLYKQLEDCVHSVVVPLDTLALEGEGSSLTGVFHRLTE